MNLNEFKLCSHKMVIAEKLENNDSQNGFQTSNRLDNRESKDNLFYFKVVKLPDDQDVFDACGFTLAKGDVIISQSLGTPVWFDDLKGGECRIFELKYIIGKILGDN